MRGAGFWTRLKRSHRHQLHATNSGTLALHSVEQLEEQYPYSARGFATLPFALPTLLSARTFVSANPGSLPIAILILSSSFSKHTRAYSLLRLPVPLAGPCWTLSIASSGSWTSKVPRAFLERGLLVPRQLSRETAHHRVLAGFY